MIGTDWHRLRYSVLEPVRPTRVTGDISVPTPHPSPLDRTELSTAPDLTSPIESPAAALLAGSPSALATSYDCVAGEYTTDVAGELAGKPLDRALFAVFAEQVRPIGPVRDAGCGPGHVAAFLAALGCAVDGVDLSAGIVAEARRLYPPAPASAGGPPGLAFRGGDLRALPAPDGAYGGVVAFYSVIHSRQGGWARPRRSGRACCAPAAARSPPSTSRTPSADRARRAASPSGGAKRSTRRSNSTRPRR